VEALEEDGCRWECEFFYQPKGWPRAYRFVALRYEKTREEMDKDETEQYQLFETSQYDTGSS